MIQEQLDDKLVYLSETNIMSHDPFKIIFYGLHDPL